MRSRRGLKGISPHEKRLLRSGATLLEDKYSVKVLSFGTATLPVGSGDFHEQACKHWAEICRQFFQGLRRLMEARGLNPNAWVYCSEIQERRWETRGEFCPHLHWVMLGRQSQGGWAISPLEITALWQRVLTNVTGHEVDCRAACRIEQLRKSAAGYLSKYMSKGGKALEAMRTTISPEWIPTSWAGCSKTLRKAVLERVVTTHVNVAGIANDLQLLATQGKATFHWIELESLESNKTLRLGFVGRIFSRDDYQTYAKAIGYEAD
jgi:hypothetical protein